ncbi:uncharacterized protein PODANS_2_9960 [Podospora anserina S mat+]|uniref:Podospora anserina S mat+ genomic DNA chromosome 2, supercontig 2 n=1 Tax=Podospora anserina (strain S / ATCC MYA-4624 / DSM 980 / FGSC 10383) TaxID=515849 RepID=B2B755_PODAN|nr:uncharacterized protein PODANS_2_9960 [Podospora anserina S mat+]CAP73633.1 unnamed protein product [Podospora anserina S mat+]
MSNDTKETKHRLEGARRPQRKDSFSSVHSAVLSWTGLQTKIGPKSIISNSSPLSSSSSNSTSSTATQHTATPSQGLSKPQRRHSHSFGTGWDNSNRDNTTKKKARPASMSRKLSFSGFMGLEDPVSAKARHAKPNFSNLDPKRSEESTKSGSKNGSLEKVNKTAPEAAKRLSQASTLVGSVVRSKSPPPPTSTMVPKSILRVSSPDGNARRTPRFLDPPGPGEQPHSPTLNAALLSPLPSPSSSSEQQQTPPLSEKPPSLSPPLTPLTPLLCLFFRLFFWALVCLGSSLLGFYWFTFLFFLSFFLFFFCSFFFPPLSPAYFFSVLSSTIFPFVLFYTIFWFLSAFFRYFFFFFFCLLLFYCLFVLFYDGSEAGARCVEEVVITEVIDLTEPTEEEEDGDKTVVELPKAAKVSVEEVPAESPTENHHPTPDPNPDVTEVDASPLPQPPSPPPISSTSPAQFKPNTASFSHLHSQLLSSEKEAAALRARRTAERLQQSLLNEKPATNAIISVHLASHQTLKSPNFPAQLRTPSPGSEKPDNRRRLSQTRSTADLLTFKLPEPATTGSGNVVGQSAMASVATAVGSEIQRSTSPNNSLQLSRGRRERSRNRERGYFQVKKEGVVV